MYSRTHSHTHACTHTWMKACGIMNERRDKRIYEATKYHHRKKYISIQDQKEEKTICSIQF